MEESQIRHFIIWWEINIAFFALPNPLSWSAMYRLCLNQEISEEKIHTATHWLILMLRAFISKLDEVYWSCNQITLLAGYLFIVYWLIVCCWRLVIDQEDKVDFLTSIMTTIIEEILCVFIFLYEYLRWRTLTTYDDFLWCYMYFRISSYDY